MMADGEIHPGRIASSQGLEGDAGRVFERPAVRPRPRQHAQAMQVAHEETGEGPRVPAGRYLPHLLRADEGAGEGLLGAADVA